MEQEEVLQIWLHIHVLTADKQMPHHPSIIGYIDIIFIDLVHVIFAIYNLIIYTSI